MSYELVKPKWDSYREVMRSIHMRDGHPEEYAWDIPSSRCFICLHYADGSVRGICAACEKEFPIKKNHQRQ